MLVLTRRINEKIIIDDGRIIITLCGVSADRARIGIAAPPGCPIHREEVYRIIVEERRAQADGRGTGD